MGWKTRVGSPSTYNGILAAGYAAMEGFKSSGNPMGHGLEAILCFVSTGKHLPIYQAEVEMVLKDWGKLGGSDGG